MERNTVNEVVRKNPAAAVLPSFARRVTVIAAFVLAPALSGCWLFAAGAGAQAGYIASQDKPATQTIQDQAITASVKSKLLVDQTVKGLDINVDTDYAIVTLRGVVKTDHEVRRALEIARSVDGVKEVRSDLVVIP